jgi:hypothetical protein
MKIKTLVPVLVLCLTALLLCAACNEKYSTPGGPTGTLTITDIPQAHNGRFAYFEENKDSPYIVGCESIFESDKITFVRISEGTVEIPVWMWTGEGYETFSGSGDYDIVLWIISGSNPTVSMAADPNIQAEEYFLEIPFTEGEAEISWDDRYIEESSGT